MESKIGETKLLNLQNINLYINNPKRDKFLRTFSRRKPSNMQRSNKMKILDKKL